MRVSQCNAMQSVQKYDYMTLTKRYKTVQQFSLRHIHEVCHNFERPLLLNYHIASEPLQPQQDLHHNSQITPIKPPCLTERKCYL